MGTQPCQKLETRYRTRIRVLCPPEVISLHPSGQAEALQPDSCIQDQDRRKKGRIGGVGKKKGRGKGKEVNKVPYPEFLVGALWPVV